MKVRAFAASDIGREREQNEDCFEIDNDLGVYIVCDGMGGHAAGEVASSKAVEYVMTYLRDEHSIIENADKSPDGHFRVLQLAEDAVQYASERLYLLACSEAELSGMGTTLTLLLVAGNKGILAHVGDTRLYLWRDGTAHQLTTDHTMANEMVASGAMNADEAADHRFAHALTRSIGQQGSVQVESLLFDLSDGDTILICSDGLSNYFRDKQHIGEFLADETIDNTAQSLVAFANQSGGSDNITAVVLRTESGDHEIPDADFKQCIAVLKTVFLFRGLSLSRLSRVMNITSIRHFKSGNQVVASGENCNGIYMVLDGELSSTSAEGMPVSIQEGESFGEASLARKRNSIADVVATEDSRVLFIARDDFERLTRRQPRLGRQLLQRLATHLAEKLDEAWTPGDRLRETDDWGQSKH